MTDAVQYEARDGVATITLNRPEVLNALNDAVMRGLAEALAAARADEAVRALLVTGAGRGFSSGADLTTTGVPPADVARLLRERYHPVILGMRDCPKPIVCAVNGVAAGAGMSLALAGDVVLAARSATFVQAFARIGLVPDAGSTWFLTRFAGDARARALAMLAERIDAAQAQACGLVWAVHDDEALLPEARRLAAHLATQPTRALALIKQAMSAAPGHTLAQQLELEADLQAQAAATEDFREGVAAFLQKRAPRFAGR